MNNTKVFFAHFVLRYVGRQRNNYHGFDHYVGRNFIDGIHLCLSIYIVTQITRRKIGSITLATLIHMHLPSLMLHVYQSRRMLNSGSCQDKREHHHHHKAAKASPSDQVSISNAVLIISPFIQVKHEHHVVVFSILLLLLLLFLLHLYLFVLTLLDGKSFSSSSYVLIDLFFIT